MLTVLGLRHSGLLDLQEKSGLPPVCLLSTIIFLICPLGLGATAVLSFCPAKRRTVHTPMKRPSCHSLTAAPSSSSPLFSLLFPWIPTSTTSSCTITFLVGFGFTDPEHRTLMSFWAVFYNLTTIQQAVGLVLFFKAVISHKWGEKGINDQYNAWERKRMLQGFVFEHFSRNINRYGKDLWCVPGPWNSSCSYR